MTGGDRSCFEMNDLARIGDKPISRGFNLRPIGKYTQSGLRPPAAYESSSKRAVEPVNGVLRVLCTYYWYDL